MGEEEKIEISIKKKKSENKKREKQIFRRGKY